MSNSRYHYNWNNYNHHYPHHRRHYYPLYWPPYYPDYPWYLDDSYYVYYDDYEPYNGYD